MDDAPVETATDATIANSNLVQIAEALGAEVIETEPTEAEEIAVVNATEVFTEVPHCEEHDLPYEWRVSPAKPEDDPPKEEVGKWVHRTVTTFNGRERKGWCVKADD